MAYSSDDDSDETLIPDSVTNYHLVDNEEELISFSDLPQIDSPNPPLVYLLGTTEDGLQQVYKRARAWKLDISQKTGPDVFVLLDGKWSKLLKPRKSYEEIVRSILITIQALHFLRWNPNAEEKSLWENLRRIFDKFEVRPSESDFRPHIAFMKQFAEKDETLGRSQLLKGFLEGKGRRRSGEGNSGAPEVKESFIAEDDEVDETRDTKGDESGEEDADLFDSVCSICDNGGDLLCCEGECMRSFHATEEAGEDSACESLGLTIAEVEKIQNFLCKNCKVKRHQCFACGKLGSSDKSKGAEVFQCSNATCGYFYHPTCVANLLHPGDEAAASDCKKTVLEGRFACPCHRCAVCKKLEVKADPDLQFAMCRRCPKSYHRKCLPSKIAFTADPENGIMIRAWEDLLPNRILIYCLEHKIDEELLTPNRDHIVFPETKAKEKIRLPEIPSRKQKPPLAKSDKLPTATNQETLPSDRRPLKKRAIVSEEGPSSSKRRGVRSPCWQDETKAIFPKKTKNFPKLRENDSLAEEGRGTAVACRRSPSPREVAAGDSEDIPRSSFPIIEPDVEAKMKKLLERESVSRTSEDVRKRHKIPQTYQNSSRYIDKVTRGKIEGSVEAIKTAYQRISDGGSVDDAKAICEPEVVKHVARCHRRLGVYLSPFLHGMQRYSSFGRHFTKEEKLQEICSMLQWYVKNNDTIVDFCCGSNDFSRIMKEKMDAMGKRCNFKNYDIFPPKDDFCFEKRDWMTVKPNELPTGSSLIMGLNPPFGVKAALANKFIDKALTFKPKLVILIVPKETERLDQKMKPYDLVWADNVTLSGKSFYMPGLVDANDKQIEQWNISPPLLYLWSRSDFTVSHKEIAEEHGHFSNLSEDISASPPLSPPPSEEEQKKAEDIISQVVGDISVINNEVMTEVMEMKQENAASRKGKDKVDPVPPKVESGVKTEPVAPAVLKRKEREDVAVNTTATNEIRKVDDSDQGREKKGSMEGTGSHREARGTGRQNEGRGGKADQNPGASGPHKEDRVNLPHNEGAVRGPRNEHRDYVHHDEGGASRNHQEARTSGSHRIGKSPDVREGGYHNKTRSPDTREIRRRSPEMRTSGADHSRRRSPPGVTESRSHRMRRSEDRAAGLPNNANVSDMEISPREDNRQNTSAIRGDSTATWENNNNPSRYNSSTNRGRNTLQKENNDAANGDILPLVGSQYVNNVPLMDQPIETRQLDSQLDFPDLGPIFSNGNDDFDNMARQYSPSPSYNWPPTGSGSILDYNRGRGADYMDPRFEEFDGFSRFYGSHEENRHNNFGEHGVGNFGENRHNNFGVGPIGHPSSTFHTSASLSSYGLSGLSGSTSTSAMDRYAPRLDETNFLRPGGLGLPGGSHQYHQGLGGFGGLSSGPPHYSYDMHGMGRREVMPPPHPDPSRQLHSFQPPPGSSGGWLDD